MKAKDATASYARKQLGQLGLKDSQRVTSNKAGTRLGLGKPSPDSAKREITAWDALVWAYANENVRSCHADGGRDRYTRNDQWLVVVSC
jgi:hypothetical protein